MTTRITPSSATLAILVSIIGLTFFRTLALSTGISQTHAYLRTSRTFGNLFSASIRSTTRQLTTLSASNPEVSSPETAPLCDLQTFLRLCDFVDSGGEAKTVIQDSKCALNGTIETRRGKKLYPGDKVSYLSAVDLDVATVVGEKGYVYKLKVKKVKPLPKVDDEGNFEFGGRYRSEEWRAERKVKKAERKAKNKMSG